MCLQKKANLRRRIMDLQAAKMIGAGLAVVALLGVGIGEKNREFYSIYTGR